MNNSVSEEDEMFSPDEYVDIINPETKSSYEGKIISIKGELIIVENLHKRKEEKYKRSDKRIIKQWIPGNPIKKLNRVDFQLKGTEFWVEGIVIDIKPNNKLLIKYKNNNNFKPFIEEIVDIDDTRLAKPGYYTKYDSDTNKLLASTVIQENKSKINGNVQKILNNKRKRSDENSDSLSLNEEDKFLKLLLEKNLTMNVVSGDGNCMFRAVSDQVYGTDKHYAILRQKCMDYIELLKSFFEPYIDEDFDKYIKRMREDKTWGDDIELEALSELYSRPIEIFNESAKPLKTFHENINCSDSPTKYIKFSMSPIRLSYHKKNHYNSIVPIKSDKINYRRYQDSLITTPPGIYESKTIAYCNIEEYDFQRTIQMSDRLKKNLSKKLENMANNIDLNEEKEEKEENTKNKKIKKEDKEIIEEKNKQFDKEKDDDKESENENKEKNKKGKDISHSKSKKLGNQDDNDDYFLSIPEIRQILDCGFDYNDIKEAYQVCEGDKETMVNYLLQKQKNN